MAEPLRAVPGGNGRAGSVGDAFGFAYAGARLHVGSIWALAVLHGLSNFSQDRLAGEVPGPMYLAVAVLLAAYGLVLMRVAERSSQEGSTDTNGDG